MAYLLLLATWHTVYNCEWLCVLTGVIYPKYCKHVANIYNGIMMKNYEEMLRLEISGRTGKSLLFLHQLTQNMTTDYLLNYMFNT